MNYILFDGPSREHLLPFTFTRPVADIRAGAMTLREKWESYLGKKTSSLTQDYLSEKFSLVKESVNTLIDGSVVPNENFVEQIKSLEPGEALVQDGKKLAVCVKEDDIYHWATIKFQELPVRKPVMAINQVWDIYAMNHQLIEQDFQKITKGRKTQPLSKTNFVLGDEALIFLEEGAKVEFAFLNTTDGPIYVGRDAEIMEGSKIRGPFALCEHATVKMDAKIYTGTTIGPHCKVGGEISNSVIFGYSNKAHDGFLGNSVIGEWCNLGADTNISNLKNTYDIVKLWSYPEQRFVNTGQQFCGLMMGDHSKTGINTMFNTGTVVGVSSNIFGEGYPRNFIPSFSWGGKQGISKFNLKKAFQVAKAVMDRRHIEFDTVEENILTHIYDSTFQTDQNA
ncbi:MAG: GlmU family protein [Bacteroidales bacterium]|nr:GlmU family protein [Bacteroidales bacterium]